VGTNSTCSVTLFCGGTEELVKLVACVFHEVLLWYIWEDITTDRGKRLELISKYDEL
jgi:hypothetical protein